VAVAGASGLVGTRLLPALVARGHQVVGLTRGAAKASTNGVRWATWDPGDPASVARALAGTDAVVSLAGENLFAQRWREPFLRRLRESRVDVTRGLVTAIAGLPRRPRVLVSASAVGYYGPRDPGDVLTEEAPPGDDFLARLCRDWEAEAVRAEEHGVRVACARTGIVLDREGGALAQMARPFRLFVGGPIGRGRQAMSWIHATDHVAMLVRALEDARWRGPFNAVAPNPVTNREFAKALGRALRRPSFLPTPVWALRIVLGKVASVVGTGQRVVPAAALSRGFRFRYPDLDGALAEVYR
jgi:uncharacterized protein (TIGR01777 family)